MKLKVIGFLLGGLMIGIIIGGIIVCGGLSRTVNSGVSSGISQSAGQKISDFELKSIEGETISFSRYRGKPVIINFWATWCDPCKREMPLLESAYERNKPNLIILGVNVDEDPATIRPFLNQYKLTFPILLDAKGEVQYEFAVRGFPTSIFVDKDGKMQAQHIGELNQESLNGYLVGIGVK